MDSLLSAASAMAVGVLPFTPESANTSSCHLYTVRAGDTLARLSALGRISVSSILKDNWNLDLLNSKLGMKVRMCNMPGIPKGEVWCRPTPCFCKPQKACWACHQAE
jgi:hypothetical protein